jgi:hypothetical protein
VNWGSGGIPPCIIDLGTRWRWGVNFTPRPLYPQGKSPWGPLDWRLGGPQNRSGRGGEEKNSQPLPGLEPSIIQPEAQRYTIELSQLCRWTASFNNFKHFIACSFLRPCAFVTAQQNLFNNGTTTLRHHVQTGSGAHPASYPMGTGSKAVGAWSWTHPHLVPRSKNAWCYTSTPPTRLHGVVLS